MPNKSHAKIIQFPIAKKQADTTSNDILTELKAALSEAEAIHVTKEPVMAPMKQEEGLNRTRTAPNIVINGGQVGQIGDIHNTYNVEKLPTPTVIVQTGVGTIDAQQKRRLLDLRDEIVNDSVVRNTPKMPASVMIGLNRYMKVNKYDEILASDFEKALNWMIRQRAILNSARSAPKKLPAWRNGRIKAIHSRCKEKGFESWRIEYMKKKFNKESMIELADDELEALYRTVMSKK